MPTSATSALFFVALGDFVGDAGQGALHRRSVENYGGMGLCTARNRDSKRRIVFHALATSPDRI